jgi:hypothetical protein
VARGELGVGAVGSGRRREASSGSTDNREQVISAESTRSVLGRSERRCREREEGNGGLNARLKFARKRNTTQGLFQV